MQEDAARKQKEKQYEKSIGVYDMKEKINYGLRTIKAMSNKQTKVINRVQMLYLLSFLFFTIVTGILFFAGYDILLVLFTLTTANIFLVIAASSGHSPYAFMGASRELV